jgi:hypothetical protein
MTYFLVGSTELQDVIPESASERCELCQNGPAATVVFVQARAPGTLARHLACCEMHSGMVLQQARVDGLEVEHVSTEAVLA